MRRTAFLSLIVCFLGVVCPADAAADQAGSDTNREHPSPRLSIYWENDGAVFLKPWGATDRYYTNGLGAAVLWQKPEWAPSLDAKGVAFGLGFGHEIYTPANLLLNPPDPNDQPYAGYLYGSALLQRETAGGGTSAHLDALRLDLGVVGPSAQAQPLQTAIHDSFTGDDPSGWGSQLSDEFAAQLGYRRKLRIDLGEYAERVRGQLIPAVELNVGTVHRNVGASVLYRVGINLPDDFGPDMLRDVASYTAAPLPPRTWSFYGYGRVTGRYVEWNTFLDGNYGEDPSPSVSKEPWVLEGEAGFALGYRWDRKLIQFNYATVWQTDLFENQQGRFSYASVGLRIVCPF